MFTKKTMFLAIPLFFFALFLTFGLGAAPARAQGLVEFGGGIEVPAGRQIDSAVAIFGPVSVDGSVREGVVCIGGPARVTGAVSEGMVVLGGPVDITGTVASLVALGGPVAVAGQVNGDLVVLGGPLRLGPAARVNGNLVIAGGPLEKDPGAVVTGDEIKMTIQQAISDWLGQWLKGYPWPGIFHPLFWWRWASLILMAVVVLIAAVLFPGPVSRVAGEAAARPGRSFLWGLLIAILALPATVLLFITILGIPVAALLWLVLACVYFLGLTGLSYLVGKKTLAALGAGQAEIYLAALLGSAIISLVSWVPYLGLFIGLVIKTVAVGAAAAALVNSRRG